MPNLTTLLAITVFTPAVAACLLLLSWLQHRRVGALGVWGFGFLTASIAAALIIVARGTIPDFLSIVVGNALLAAAYGILWCGAKKFDEKHIDPIGLDRSGGMASCLLYRPHLCATSSPRDGDGGRCHQLYTACCR